MQMEEADTRSSMIVKLLRRHLMRIARPPPRGSTGTSSPPSSLDLDAEEREDVRHRRAEWPERAVHDLERDPEAVGRRGAEEAFRPALGDPAVERLDQPRVVGDRAAGGASDARASRRTTRSPPSALREARERVRRPLERQREGRHAAAVDPGRQRARLDLRQLGDLAAASACWHGCSGEPVAVRRASRWTRQSARNPACLPEQLCAIRSGPRPHSRSSSGRGRVGEDPAHDRELLRRRPMGGADERELLVVEVGSCPRDGKRLHRLRRGAQVRDEPRVARGELDAPVADGDRVHDVARLDHVAARHLDDERLHGGGAVLEPDRPHLGVRTPKRTAVAYAECMPELPEVEAWVRELDPLVSRAPVESARPGHIATLKSFDPPPSALEGRVVRRARAAAARTSSSRPTTASSSSACT